MKKQTGITLIALVITIIVLLILAGVTIATLTGDNGLLTKAGQVKNTSEKASEEERIQVEVAGAYDLTGKLVASQVEENIRNNIKDATVTATTKESIEEKLFPVKITYNNGHKYGVTEDGAVIENLIGAGEKAPDDSNAVYISGDYTVIIPQGYTISDTNGEQNIDTGLVIKKDGNEWVWIPVSPSDLTAMYTEDLTGWIMYGTSGENAIVTKYKSISRTEIRSDLTRGNPGTTSDREPDVLSKDNDSTNLKDAGFSSYVDMATNLRSDYKNMIDSIKKYGGFYIGRYELSNTGTKKNEEPLTSIKWYGLYKICKDIDNQGVETRMIWGCQWDQVCKFVSTAKDANGSKISLTNSTKYGNYYYAQSPANTGNYEQGVKKNTGSNEAWKINNIYDLAGNCCEFTQETSNTGSRIVRGGDKNQGGGDPITYRWRMYLDNKGATSRPIMYLK